MKDKLTIPLFWKFTAAIAFTVAVFGTINLYLINNAVYDLFKKELTRHGTITAKSISIRCINPIVYNDLATLNQIVTEQTQIDSNIAYVFILDQNDNVLAHTFEQGVSNRLIKSNNSVNGETSITKIVSQQNPNILIWDMAVPIMDDNLGQVRIGLFEEDYYHSMNRTKNVFIVMVVIFFLIGIIGAFIFSYVITTPIKGISRISRKIELGTLDLLEEDFEKSLNKYEIAKQKSSLRVKDEINTLISSFRDMVSRLKTTYLELQETQRSLFQSEKMASLGILASGLAHEINNPIAGVQNSIRRLKESPENLQQNISYLEMMEDAVKRIEVLVSSLLNLSRKQDLKLGKVNLVEVIENVLFITAHKFEKTRISISKQYNHVEKNIIGSTNHIEQVLLNVVLNSIEAIEEERIQNPELNGEIIFRITDKEDYYNFKITDNGIGLGLAENQLENIFDPFFSKKKIKQGVGLGLAVSYNIIKQHNGEIKAKINKYKGLSFTITLPKFKNTD